MTSESTILLTDPATGVQRRYTRFAPRWMQFLDQYPPRDGWRVTIELSDPLEARPGLRSLYQEAIRTGRSFEEVGLARPQGKFQIFKALLMDPQGNLVAMGTAQVQTANYKAHEAGETAARQRLLAAVGLPGEEFDCDEAMDLRSQGLLVGAPQGQSDGDTGDGPGTQASQAGLDGAEADGGADGAPEHGAAEAGVISAQFWRQLEHYAGLAGEPVPEPQTLEAAQQALARLQSQARFQQSQSV